MQSHHNVPQRKFDIWKAPFPNWKEFVYKEANGRNVQCSMQLFQKMLKLLPKWKSLADYQTEQLQAASYFQALYAQPAKNVDKNEWDFARKQRIQYHEREMVKKLKEDFPNGIQAYVCMNIASKRLSITTYKVEQHWQMPQSQVQVYLYAFYFETHFQWQLPVPAVHSVQSFSQWYLRRSHVCALPHGGQQRMDFIRHRKQVGIYSAFIDWTKQRFASIKKNPLNLMSWTFEKMASTFKNFHDELERRGFLPQPNYETIVQNKVILMHPYFAQKTVFWIGQHTRLFSVTRQHKLTFYKSKTYEMSVDEIVKSVKICRQLSGDTLPDEIQQKYDKLFSFQNLPIEKSDLQQAWYDQLVDGQEEEEMEKITRGRKIISLRAPVPVNDIQKTIRQQQEEEKVKNMFQVVEVDDEEDEIKEKIIEESEQRVRGGGRKKQARKIRQDEIPDDFQKPFYVREKLATKENQEKTLEQIRQIVSKIPHMSAASPFLRAWDALNMNQYIAKKFKNNRNYYRHPTCGKWVPCTQRHKCEGQFELNYFPVDAKPVYGGIELFRSFNNRHYAMCYTCGQVSGINDLKSPMHKQCDDRQKFSLYPFNFNIKFTDKSYLLQVPTISNLQPIHEMMYKDKNLTVSAKNCVVSDVSRFTPKSPKSEKVVLEQTENGVIANSKISRGSVLGYYGGNIVEKSLIHKLQSIYRTGAVFRNSAYGIYPVQFYGQMSFVRSVSNRDQANCYLVLGAERASTYKLLSQQFNVVEAALYIKRDIIPGEQLVMDGLCQRGHVSNKINKKGKPVSESQQEEDVNKYQEFIEEVESKQMMMSLEEGEPKLMSLEEGEHEMMIEDASDDNDFEEEFIKENVARMLAECGLEHEFDYQYQKVLQQIKKMKQNDKKPDLQ